MTCVKIHGTLTLSGSCVCDPISVVCYLCLAWELHPQMKMNMKMCVLVRVWGHVRVCVCVTICSLTVLQQ